MSGHGNIACNGSKLKFVLRREIFQKVTISDIMLKDHLSYFAIAVKLMTYHTATYDSIIPVCRRHYLQLACVNDVVSDHVKLLNELEWWC